MTRRGSNHGLAIVVSNAALPLVVVAVQDGRRCDGFVGVVAASIGSSTRDPPSFKIVSLAPALD